MKTFLLLLACLANLSYAATVDQQHIRTVGTSLKGQYAAVEEYGYNSDLKTYYSRIRFMNLWKKTYVGSTVEAEQRAHSSADLEAVRSSTMARSQADLKKFGILTDIPKISEVESSPTTKGSL